MTRGKKDKGKATSHGTTASGTPTNTSTVRHDTTPPLRTELSSAMDDIRLSSSSPIRIWVKYGDGQPARIDFEGGEVYDLIEAIKKKLSSRLDNVAVDEITLRRHGEEEDLHPGLLVDESFRNDDESPLQIIVNAPVESSRERELLDRIASLEGSLNKSVHAFDVVVTPKRKPYKWAVNIEHVTLEDLKTSIRDTYQPPALDNDGAILNFMNDSERYTPRNDVTFRDMLQSLVSKNNLKFTVVIETPSKAFSDWSFPKVCQLYGLGESDDPSLSVFPPFTCEYKDLNDEPSRVILRNLITELEARLKSIPINGNEASKSQYVCSYLVAGVNLYEGKFELRPEKNITGPNGHDFAIDLLRTTKTVGVTEVKDEDIFKGIAQNAVQLESALSNRKRKANEMEEDSMFANKVFGIITDAEKWYFMECSFDDQDRLKFKLSEQVVVVYDDESMENRIRKVLGHIAWLLEEVQKPDSDSRSEERVIKKHKSADK